MNLNKESAIINNQYLESNLLLFVI